MNISKLISGNEIPSIMTLTDTLSLSPDRLLHYLITSIPKQRPIIILSLDKPSRKTPYPALAQSHTNVTLIDLFSSWSSLSLKSITSTHLSPHFYHPSSSTSSSSSSSSSSSEPLSEDLQYRKHLPLLIIDSISSLLLRSQLDTSTNTQSSSIIKWIQSLVYDNHKDNPKGFGTILCVLHADVHSDKTIDAFSYIASTSLSLSLVPLKTLQAYKNTFSSLDSSNERDQDNDQESLYQVQIHSRTSKKASGSSTTTTSTSSSSASSSISSDEPLDAMLSWVHKKTNGKLVRSKEYYKIRNDSAGKLKLKLVAFDETKTSSNTSSNASSSSSSTLKSDKDAGMDSLTTFNLNLTEEQKAEKDALILPHERKKQLHQQQQQQQDGVSSTGASFFMDKTDQDYDDDHDYDDLDDDLDI